MARNLPAIRANIRQFLRDEFVSGRDYDFPDDELDIYIQNTLIEISSKRPYKKREVVISTGSKDIDISDIGDFIDIEKAEYPVDQDPPEYRDVAVLGNTLRLNVNNKPIAGESIYLYCNKVHELTDTSSTLNMELERVLIEGVAAKTALAWINNIRTQIVEANETIKSLDAIITDINSRIAQAVNDLTTGRAKIDSERVKIDNAISNMTNRIEQALADLNTGRPLINKINIGGAPEDDYYRYATAELSSAIRYLDQGRGYLAEATSSDRYSNYAARELSVASAYLGKFGAYMNKYSSKLNIAAAITRYQNWANNQYIIYQNSLKEITKPKAWEYYPSD